MSLRPKFRAGRFTIATVEEFLRRFDTRYWAIGVGWWAFTVIHAKKKDSA